MEEIEKVRIHGLDPGNIENPEIIKNLDEIDLFFKIKELADKLEQIEKANNRNRLKNPISFRKKYYIDPTEDKYAYNFLIAQTEKFGVKVDKSPESNNLITPMFWDWFKFYNTHFFKTLTEEELTEFLDRKKNGQDVTKYMPQGTWQEAAEIAKQRHRLIRTPR